MKKKNQKGKTIVFEKLFIESQRLRYELDSSKKSDVRTELYFKYIDVLNNAAESYFCFLNEEENYDKFLIKDIRYCIDENTEIYKEYFSKEFIEFYLSSERVFFFKTLLNLHKTSNDITESILELYKKEGYNNWKNAYSFLDILILYDNKKGVLFMVDLIYEMSVDEEKYDSDLFMNAITFCIDKITFDDINYKKLKGIFEQTGNEDLIRLLPYYLDKIKK